MRNTQPVMEARQILFVIVPTNFFAAKTVSLQYYTNCRSIFYSLTCIIHARNKLAMLSVKRHFTYSAYLLTDEIKHVKVRILH